MNSSRTARRRDERAMVTAEAALALPVLICVAFLLSWAVLLVGAKIQCGDAAREAARLLARGESGTDVEAAVQQIAPDGARYTVQEQDDLVVVTVQVSVAADLPLLGSLTGVELASHAASAVEAP